MPRCRWRAAAARRERPANPYYAQSPVGFLDRNGYYSPYDVAPAAASGLFAVGSSTSYEVPYTTTAIIQYRKNGLRLVPTFQYDSGFRYGNPFTWIGYDPSSGACPATDTSQCVVADATVFRPNPYTGRFDSLGDFKSPGKLTVSMQIAKDLSKRVTATAILSNLYRHCFTRGYAWEQGGSQACNYYGVSRRTPRVVRSWATAPRPRASTACRTTRSGTRPATRASRSTPSSRFR